MKMATSFPFSVLVP